MSNPGVITTGWRGDASGTDTYDTSILASIVTLDPDTPCENAIAHLKLEPHEQLQIQSEILLQAFCNLSRDPSTARPQVLQFINQMVDLMEPLVPVEDKLTLFDEFKAGRIITSENSSSSELVPALDILKKPDSLLAKPFGLFKVLKEAKKDAVASLAAQTLEGTSLTRLDTLTASMHSSNSTEHPGRVSTTKLVACRGQLNAIKASLTPATQMRCAGKFDTVP